MGRDVTKLVSDGTKRGAQARPGAGLPALTSALRGPGPAGERGRWSPAERGSGSRLHRVQCDFVMQGEGRVLCVL